MNQYLLLEVNNDLEILLRLWIIIQVLLLLSIGTISFLWYSSNISIILAKRKSMATLTFWLDFTISNKV